MKNTTTYLFIVLWLFLLSCNKRQEPLRWNADWTAPLAHGEMSITDLLPDSVLVSNADSSMQLVFERDIFTLDYDDLVSLPDTNLLDTFALPLVTPVSFSPGQVFINQPEENVLDADGAELTILKVYSGVLEYQLESTVQGDVIYTYQIPSATDGNGVSFSKSVNVPAASAGVRTIVGGSFSLDGYTIDLTGSNGNSFNTILTSIDCKVEPNYPYPVTVSNQDTIFISNSLKSLKIDRTEGYFGNHTISTGWEETAFDGLDMFSTGNFSFENITTNLRIENGIGVDALLAVVGVTAGNQSNTVALNHSLVGTTQQLNRAYESNNTFVPAVLTFLLDDNNSNISNMLTLMPDKLGYNFNVEINPLGNISGYNDFLDRRSPLKLTLDASMPLSLIASNLTLVDTISIQISDTSMLNSMNLMIDIENGFPIAANVSMAVLDQNDKIISYIFSPDAIESGTVGVDGKVNAPSVSFHELEINGKDMERIKTYGKVILTVTFNSDPSTYTKLYDYYKLKYNVKANANVTISIK